MAWKQNVPKSQRLKGKAYTSLTGKEIGEKVLGPPCSSEYCKKSSLRNCCSFNEDQRRWIFNKFWSMSSWSERRLYVHTLVEKVRIF